MIPLTKSFPKYKLSPHLKTTATRRQRRFIEQLWWCTAGPTEAMAGFIVLKVSVHDSIILTHCNGNRLFLQLIKACFKKGYFEV